MSSLARYYTPEITLIDKTQNTVTNIAVDGSGLKGNLNKFRVSIKFSEPSIEKTRNATLTLRAPGGIFTTSTPILIDENAKDLYEVDVQYFQPLGADPKGIQGPIFRYEISKVEQATVNGGTYVTMMLTGSDIRTELVLDSDAHRFLTPKQSFLRRVEKFGFRKGADAPLVIAVTPADIELPDIAQLKQNWIPSQPTSTKKLLNDIIKRISSPEAIGTTNEDYYYYFETSATARKQHSIFAQKFGETDSGVILDEIKDLSTKTLQTQQSALIDHSKVANVSIVRGKSGVHHLPMESIRLSSDLEHAKLADDWAPTTDYFAGDYVRHDIGSGVIHLFKAIVDNTGNTPHLVPLAWEDLSTATRGSPWTASIDIWKPNMAAFQSPPAGYVGFFTDMNIVRPNYDRADETDEFESVSIKDVNDFLTGPGDIPAGEIQHGRRWLVNNGVGTDWEGHNNAVAQYDESVSPAVWRFSNAPVLNDVVHDLKSARVLKFDGVVWQTQWDLSTNFATSSPFHPVESAGMVADHRGILGKAVEFRFNWNAAEAAVDWAGLLLRITNPLLSIFGTAVSTITEPLIDDILTFLGVSDIDLENDLGLGSHKNLASRWLGFGFDLPLPKHASGSFAVGDLIKLSNMDFENKTETLTGVEGWNKGTASEDLGDIRGFQFRCKVDFEDVDNDNINGMADIPFYACWRDIADRQIWTPVKIRVNGQWGKVTIDAGPNAKGYQLFDSRIDELVTILGFTLPTNFFIKERELTGVQFDWNHVTGFKFYYQGSYDENHFYNGGQDFMLDTVVEHITQAFANGVGVVTGGFIDISNHIIDHAHIAVTDLHFLKDAYVSSEDAEVADSRQILTVIPEQSDYIDMKSIDKKIKTRRQFHPQFHVVDAWGDVRLRVGQRFKRRGANIPGGEIELVASEVTHIEDASGYHIIVKATNKFEIPE